MATDYFAISVSQESPVLHYWSLSVEEQFYFVLPFVLLALFKLPVGEKLKFCLRFTFSLLVVLVIVNINMWSSTPALSHFSTFGRMYQLASGMFLALIILDDERTNFIRRVVYIGAKSCGGCGFSWINIGYRLSCPVYTLNTLGNLFPILIHWETYSLS